MEENESVELMGVLGIGTLLKARRMELGMTHKDVAAKLDYKHESFISMVEGGATNIPLIRVFDFIQAYSLPPIMSLAVMRSLYPEAYTCVLEVMMSNPELTKLNFDNADNEVINSYKWLINEKKIKGETVQEMIPRIHKEREEKKEVALKRKKEIQKKRDEKLRLKKV